MNSSGASRVRRCSLSIATGVPDRSAGSSTYPYSARRSSRLRSRTPTTASPAACTTRDSHSWAGFATLWRGARPGIVGQKRDERRVGAVDDPHWSAIHEALGALCDIVEQSGHGRGDRYDGARVQELTDPGDAVPLLERRQQPLPIKSPDAV